jgi:hypothetical protein
VQRPADCNIGPSITITARPLTPPTASTAFMLVQDNSPTTWSASELSDILAIWRAVSEDFAPWDVDVTTEDPGAAYLGVNGIRAAIGGAFGDCKCPALCIPSWKARFWAHSVASIDPQCSTGSILKQWLQAGVRHGMIVSMPACPSACQLPRGRSHPLTP